LFLEEAFLVVPPCTLACEISNFDRTVQNVLAGRTILETPLLSFVIVATEITRHFIGQGVEISRCRHL
jgi:hypothetical protein